MDKLGYSYALEARLLDYLSKADPDGELDHSLVVDIVLPFVKQEAYIHARESVNFSMDAVIGIGVDYGFIPEDLFND